MSLGLLVAGCGDSLDCTDGTRLCEGNVSKTCVYGEWRVVVCEGNAPLCDSKYGCMKAAGTAECGNNVIESGEECDGTAVHGKTCSDVNAALAGPLKCTSACRFDTQSCVANECEEDTQQCSENVLQYCSGNVWKNVQDCAEDGLKCDPDKKRCVAE